LLPNPASPIVIPHDIIVPHITENITKLRKCSLEPVDRLDDVYERRFGKTSNYRSVKELRERKLWGGSDNNGIWNMQLSRRKHKHPLPPLMRTLPHMYKGAE